MADSHSARLWSQRFAQRPASQFLIANAIFAVVRGEQSDVIASERQRQRHSRWRYRRFDVAGECDMRLVTGFFLAIAPAALQPLTMLDQLQQLRRRGQWCDKQHFRFGKIAKLTKRQFERPQAGHVAVQQRVERVIVNAAEKRQRQMQIGHRYPAAGAQRQRSSPTLQCLAGEARQRQGKKQAVCSHCRLERNQRNAIRERKV